MSNRVFSLLHLSLIGKRQPELDAFRGTREEWLREALSVQFEFSGWGGKRLVWVPRSVNQDLIFGLIQGKRPHSYHASPSEGGEEKEDFFWQGAYFYLDPAHHKDGQKVAIENDVLGKPIALAKALFSHISEQSRSPFEIIPQAIFDEGDFWKFVKESEGALQYIKFSFVVPNMWGPQNDLEEDLKETGRETGSEKVDVVFRSRQGVKADSNKVRDGVSYAGRGSGAVTARNLKGRKYSSRKKTSTESIPVDEFESKSEIDLLRIGRRLLGRG